MNPPAGAPQNAGDTTAANDERDRIAVRAYELYLSRGGHDGSDLDDWLQAEREVTGPTQSAVEGNPAPGGVETQGLHDVERSETHVERIADHDAPES